MMSEELKNKVIDLHKKGLSNTEISKKVNVERHTVGAIIKEREEMLKSATLGGTGFVDIDELNKQRKTIISAMPSLAESAKADPVIRAAMNRNKIFVLSDEEERAIKEFRKMHDDGLGHKRGEIAGIFAKFLWYVVRNYGNKGQYIDSNDVYMLFQNSLDFFEYLNEKNYNRQDLDKFTEFFNRVFEMNLKNEDIIKINDVLKKSAQKKFDLMRLIKNYNSDDIFEILYSYPQMVKNRSRLAEEVSDLNAEKTKLSEEIEVMGNIATLKRELFDLSVKKEKLKKENQILLKRNTNIKGYFEIIERLPGLSTEEKELKLKNEILANENQQLLQQNSDIKHYKKLIEELPSLTAQVQVMKDYLAIIQHEIVQRQGLKNLFDTMIVKNTSDAYKLMIMLDFFSKGTNNDIAKVVVEELRQQFSRVLEEYQKIKNNKPVIQKSIALPDSSSASLPKLIIPQKAYQLALNTTDINQNKTATASSKRAFTIAIPPVCERNEKEIREQTL